MARLRSLDPVTAFDVALVVFVAVVTEWGVFENREHMTTPIAGPRWLTVSLPLLLALPLLWRRTRPLLVTALVMGGIVAQAVASGDSPEGLQLIALWVVVPYSVAAYSDRRGALAGLAISLATFAVYAAENDDIASGTSGDLWSGAFFLVLAVGAWLAGMVVRERREAAALEREAEAATLQERARMARELHDIVSHNLSVVVVQAAGARAQAGGDESTLEKIERSGREALVEMRRLLGVLREDGTDKAALTPAPGIAQLPALVDGVRAAGLVVDLDVGEGCATLPPALDLSAYRIVQEALTNALKHAGAGAHARVALLRDEAGLTIAVVDDGAVNGHVPPSGPGGHGLAGMRERVDLLGGELHAAPRADGGFAVAARLPIA
jgi:signal transduction histidine kinase